MNLSSAAAGFGLAIGSALSLLAPSGALAAQTTVVSYDFTGAVGTPTATAAGVSGSEFVRDDSANTVYDNTAGNPAPDANSNDWPTAITFDPSLYYSFTVTPAKSGTSWDGITLDVANFDSEGINDGPTRFVMRSSLDGFSANLLSGVIAADFTTDSGAVSVNTTDPVEYRVFGFGAGSSAGLFQIDNVALTLGASAPEPSSLAIVALAAASAGIAIFRRRG